MDEETPQRDTLWWIKEKQALERQLAEKDKEITTVKSRNYDLLKQVEELTQKLQKVGAYPVAEAILLDFNFIVVSDFLSFELPN